MNNNQTDNNNSSNSRYDDGMKRLLNDIKGFNNRVIHLQLEGIEAKEACHIAEKECYNKLMRDAGFNPIDVTIDNVTIKSNVRKAGN